MNEIELRKCKCGGELCIEVSTLGSRPFYDMGFVKCNSCRYKTEEHYVSVLAESFEPERYQSIDHDGTDEIVCPWCGHEHSDSFEYDEKYKQTCDNCGKVFTFSKDMTVTYNTRRWLKTRSMSKR